VKERDKGGRRLKAEVYELLCCDDFKQGMKKLREYPPRQVINPLFSYLFSLDEKIRWRAVEAVGLVVKDLACKDMESARVIMRRLMWSLNDESGGIGWGSAEAMGEILSRHKGLADEFQHILFSYAHKDGNYLELGPLQRGLLWGIGRFAQARPQKVKEAMPYMLDYLESDDSTVRGLCVWITGIVKEKPAVPRLLELIGDEAALRIYREGRMRPTTVGALSKEALENIKGQVK